jgi:hypothetical protein
MLEDEELLSDRVQISHSWRSAAQNDRQQHGNTLYGTNEHSTSNDGLTAYSNALHLFDIIRSRQSILLDN